MIIGIVGLGLIGGSMAKAYKEAGHKVYAYDIDETILSFAMVGDFIDDRLTDENMVECDCIFISLYPQATIDYFRTKAPKMKKGQLVIDCCGVKEKVCRECFHIGSENGVTFVGGHPMAGKHQSGFAYSRASLYRGASMVIVPDNHNDLYLLDRVNEVIKPLGFARVTVTSAKEHDRMIAFTSQLAHVVSNAYVKSPTAKEHKGYSAGSYKDLTRVAWLNENMWTELFMDNKENLIGEIDKLIESLISYKRALSDGDDCELKRLLYEGKMCKEEIDGR